ncbi:helix-turn-helix transcriptional regulator [Streptomyces sp. NBC_00391]
MADTHRPGTAGQSTNTIHSQWPGRAQSIPAAGTRQMAGCHCLRCKGHMVCFSPSTVPAQAALSLVVAVACNDGDWRYRNQLIPDDALCLRQVRPPYEQLHEVSCHVVLVCGSDAARNAARLLSSLGEGTPPVLLLCPAGEPQQIAAAFRLGVTSCLTEEDCDSRTLKNAIRSTAAGHTHLSPAAVDAIAQVYEHPAARPGGVPRGGGARLRPILSPRERQVMDLVVRGVRVAEIGQRLSLTAKTVRSYLSNIYTKLGVSSRMEAVLLWLDAGSRPDAPYGHLP